MQQFIVAALIAFLIQPVSAQLFDDFSDGEIVSSPAWTGDVSDFIVNPDNQLQLNAASAGSSTLWTAVQFPDSVQWQCYYKMGFAPSASNRLRIYLMADTTEADIANGYVLEIGENGGDDAMHLYSLEGGSTFLIASSDGVFGSDPSEAMIEVKRGMNDTWTLTATTPATTVSFTAFDGTTPVSEGRYFGIQCIYTDSRKDKFFFDDILIADIIADMDPPILEEVVILDAEHVELIFNEPLLPSSIVPDSISVSPGLGEALAAVLSSEHVVEVTLPFAMMNGIEYSLSVSGFRDLAGNRSPVQMSSFTFTQIDAPGVFDILINELLPDPSPVVGLPNAEFIELYNPTEKTYDLSQLDLQVGSTRLDLPEGLLAPGGYVILCDTDNADDFAPFGDVVGINLPTLTNTGARIQLHHDTDITIHDITYDVTWYRDAVKDDGGWSLELINPQAPCLRSTNWRASVSTTGGTPGAANSILDQSSADISGPQVLTLVPDLSGLSIALQFDELLGNSPPIVTLIPDAGNIITEVVGENMTVFLNMALEPSVLYTIRIVGMTDCIGNVSDAIERTFGLPSTPDAGDLVINELLFDPQTGGQRFIEFFNLSSKFLSTAELQIAEISGGFTELTPVTTDFLIFPQSFVVVTPDPVDLIARYPAHNQEVIITSALPAFDRKEGTIGVAGTDGTLIDEFDYSTDLHHPLLDDTKGVSLERLSINAPTNDAGNWHSAAEGIGFATPGLPNSQAVMPGGPGGIYSIINSTFSPDGDGFEDLLLVQFDNPVPGSIATITVFDAMGREIKRILRSALIGDGSLAQWDGTTFESLKAPTGIYVLRIEIFDGAGNKRGFKEVAVLATRI